MAEFKFDIQIGFKYEQGLGEMAVMACWLMYWTRDQKVTITLLGPLIKDLTPQMFKNCVHS